MNKNFQQVVKGKEHKTHIYKCAMIGDWEMRRKKEQKNAREKFRITELN